MIRKIIELNILLSFIFSLFSQKVFSQNFDETFKIANIYFENLEYEKSIKLLDRLIFFTDDRIKKCNIYLKKTDCYIAINNYALALNSCDSAITYSLDNDIPVLKKASVLILTNNHRSALKLLNNYDFSNKKSIEYDLNSLLGIIYFIENKYNESENYFLQNINESNKAEREELKDIFQKFKTEKKFNVKTAKILSSIIPGSGMLYSNNFINGSKSFVLVSSLVLLGVNFYMNFTFLDCMISIFPWFLRYYKSGIIKSGEISSVKNDMLKSKYLQEIIQTQP